jgi:hypothetical protein
MRRKRSRSLAGSPPMPMLPSSRRTCCQRPSNGTGSNAFRWTHSAPFERAAPPGRHWRRGPGRARRAGEDMQQHARARNQCRESGRSNVSESNVAQRCNEALELPSTSDISAVQLGIAAMLLRSAADDLVSLVEGPGVVALVTETPAFGPSFGMNPDQDPASAVEPAG